MRKTNPFAIATLTAVAQASIAHAQVVDSNAAAATMPATSLPGTDATVAVGAERADYKAAATTVDATRRDDFVFTRASVDWAVLKHCSLGVFYEFSKNLSKGTEGHPFQRNRAGLSVSLSF